MAERERRATPRQGDGDQIVGAGQEPRAMRGQPARGLVAVTLRTMPVAARVKRDTPARPHAVHCVSCPPQAAVRHAARSRRARADWAADAIPEARAYAAPWRRMISATSSTTTSGDRSEAVASAAFSGSVSAGANLARQMRVDLGRPRTAMAEGVLDDPQIDAGFQ